MNKFQLLAGTSLKSRVRASQEGICLVGLSTTFFSGKAREYCIVWVICSKTGTEVRVLQLRLMPLNGISLNTPIGHSAQSSYPLISHAIYGLAGEGIMTKVSPLQ